ncbi:Hypothetical protein SMAX5B_016243 [Scophthalmus maximus]|uniref:Uncharacterized protein n=1 Tax=Scophthalmus maximus TaxID=52904 RepID=A0A2U9BLE4_SCOMX|nr:Hypothetical protein SMAX5B_016243 [Scophthalmus maximus]
MLQGRLLQGGGVLPSPASFGLGLADGGLVADWLCSSRRFSLSSSARMAARVVFWKPGPGGLAAMLAERGAQVHGCRRARYLTSRGCQGQCGLRWLTDGHKDHEEPELSSKPTRFYSPPHANDYANNDANTMRHIR